MDVAAIVAAALTGLKDLDNVQLLFILALIYLIIKSLPKISRFVNRIRGKEVPQDKKKNKHCNLDDIKSSPVLMAFIEKRVNVENKISDIKRYDRVTESHIKIKDLSDAIHRLMMSHFKTLISDKGERRLYDYLLSKALEPGRDEMRIWVKRNRLLERTDSDFKHYCKDTAEKIMSISTEDIDKLYFDEDFSIARDDLKKSYYDKICKDILDMIEDTLFDIREIFKSKEKEIQKIREEE